MGSFLSLITLLLVSNVSRGMLCAFSISSFEDVVSYPLFSSCLISLFVSLMYSVSSEHILLIRKAWLYAILLFDERGWYDLLWRYDFRSVAFVCTLECSFPSLDL